MNKINYFPIVLILSLLKLGTLSAQTTIGIKGGLNHSNLISNNMTPEAFYFIPIARWHIGIVANHKISDKISFQPELIYTQKGAQSGLFDTEYHNHKYTYISIPLLLSYKVNVFQFEIGPDFGYLINTDIVVEGERTHSSYSVVETNFDVSLDIGIKYKFGRGFSQIRWQRSLFPIGEVNFNDVNGSRITTVAYYPTAIQLSLGYQL